MMARLYEYRNKLLQWRKDYYLDMWPAPSDRPDAVLPVVYRFSDTLNATAYVYFCAAMIFVDRLLLDEPDDGYDCETLAFDILRSAEYIMQTLTGRLAFLFPLSLALQEMTRANHDKERAWIVNTFKLMGQSEFDMAKPILNAARSRAYYPIHRRTASVYQGGDDEADNG